MATKFDSYQAVTDTMMAALAEGTVPWHKPWNPAMGRPRSMSTGKAYQGINVMLLGITAQARGYTSPWWGTVKAINAAGGHVRKGQSRKTGTGSTMVTFWKTFTREVTNEQTGERETRKGFLLRVYSVFNAEQCEGLPEKYYPKPGETPEFAEIPEPQSVLDAYLPQLAGVAHNQADAAHYIPAIDKLELPPREAFRSPAGYYYAAFHEVTHSTGHTSRLNRAEGMRGHFGSGPYAKEELVAEMGSAFLLAASGISDDDRTAQSADYIKGWLTALGNDPKLVIQAAAAAEKAAGLVLTATETTIELAA